MNRKSKFPDLRLDWSVCALSLSFKTDHLNALANDLETSNLVFLWKNVLQPDFKLVEDGFQFVQGQMMFTAFDSEKRLMGQANSFGELGIRKPASLPFQKSGQFPVEIAMHTRRLANGS
jgi:hypothetical protein